MPDPAPISPQTLTSSALRRVSIAELDPSANNNASQYVHGVVVLVWPYSSSTRSTSLLLGDADIRLRKRKGQVKVTFLGECAQEVARSRIGIGDSIQLCLDGAQSTSSADEVSTPGKKIDFDLVFQSRAVLDATRDGVPVASVNVKVSKELALLPGTGARSPNGLPIQPDTLPWSSPAASKNKRPSSGFFLDPSLDPFVGDDGSVTRIGRKRTKFARSSDSWLLLERTPSPEKDTMDERPDDQAQTLAPDDVRLLSQDLITTERIIAPPSPPTSAEPEVEEPIQNQTELMLPPQILPLIPVPPTSTIHETPRIDDEEALPPPQATTTPRLEPLTSANLPLISPLIKHQGFGSGYFPDSAGERSELDASANVIPIENDSTPPMHQDFGIVTQSSYQEQQPTGDDNVGTYAPGSIFEFLNHSPVEPVIPPEEKWQTLPEVTQPNTSNQAQNLQSPTFTSLLNEDRVPTERSPMRSDRTSDWKSKVETSAVECETDSILDPPPFPFRQGWHRKSSPKSNTRTPQYSLDGAHDENSSIGSSSQASESELSEDGHPEGIFPQVETTLGQGPVNIFEEGLVADEPELSADQHKQPQPPTTVEPIEICSSSDDELEETMARTNREPRTTISKDGEDLIPIPQENLMKTTALGDEYPSSPLIEPDLPLDVAPQRIITQLETPANTQEELLSSQPHEQMLQSVQEPDSHLPLTPRNTQESGILEASEELPAELVPERDVNISPENKIAPKISEIEKFSRASKPSKRPPRDSALPKPILEVVSPYFTPRRRSQILKPPPSSPLDRVANPNDKAALHDQDNKFQVKTGLTTSYSYFAPLASLHDHFSQLVDVLAVCTTPTSEHLRTEKGPKDWYTTLHLVDPSFADTTTVTLQVFRPFKRALPRAERGNIILLRGVEVQSQKRQCMLLSTLSSAWAILSPNLTNDSKANTFSVVTTGPPVEYGAEEKGFAKDLRAWWVSEGAAKYPDQPVTPAAKKGIKKAEPNTDSEENRTPGMKGSPEEEPAHHELRGGKVYTGSSLVGPKEAETEVGYHELRNGRKYPDRSSSPEVQRTRKPRQGSVVHELRDGVRYIDKT